MSARRVAHQLVGHARDVVRAGARPIRTLRWSSDPNLRRPFPARARAFARSLLVAVAALAIALLISVLVGSWLVFAGLVLVFLGEAVVLRWRGRARAGCTHGLPIGSVDGGPEAFTDPEHFRHRAQRFGPIFKTSYFGAPTVCVVDLPRATSLLRVHADDLEAAWATYDRFVPGGTIRQSDGPRHAELRQVFARALAPAVVRSWRPVMVAVVHTQLQDMARESVSTPGGLHPLEHVRELVTAAFAELLLGIPSAAPDYPEVRALIEDLDPDRHHHARGHTDDEVTKMLERLSALVQRADERVDPRAEVESLARRLDEMDPGALRDPAIVRNLIYLTVNASNDVAGLLTWVLWYLGDDPSWQLRLRTDEADDAGLPRRVISETLRLSQSEYLFRSARHSIEFEDIVIPAGFLVRVCTREIHRDPRTFVDADRFDPDRFIGDPYGREAYAPFGIDHRSCIGEVLTRTLAEVLVGELATGFELETVRDGPLEMSRDRHWAPSSRWRIVLRRRPATRPGSDAERGR